MYKFGKQSKKVLDTVNKYLVLAAEGAIMESMIDISIPEWGGLRTAKYQKSLFDKDWSKADGTKKISNHQKMDAEEKAMALDLCAYYKGKQNWNKERLIYIAGLMLCSFEALKRDGQIPTNLHIHWGGFWKSTTDSMGWDLPHFQISNRKQTTTL